MKSKLEVIAKYPFPFAITIKRINFGGLTTYIPITKLEASKINVGDIVTISVRKVKK